MKALDEVSQNVFTMTMHPDILTWRFGRILILKELLLVKLTLEDEQCDHKPRSRLLATDVLY